LYKTASSLFCILLISEQNKTNKKPTINNTQPCYSVRGDLLVLRHKDRIEEILVDMVRAHQGCWGNYRDIIQRAWASQELLVHFFHARGILITL